MKDWANDCEAIRQTISLYCQLLDDQRFDELARLFTIDAILPWQGRTLRGREEIARELPSTQRPKGTTRHLPMSPVIDIRPLESGGSREARAWADVIVTVHPPDAPAFIGWTGRYHERYALEDEQWRIHHHVAVAIGEALPEGVEPVISVVMGRSCS